MFQNCCEYSSQSERRLNYTWNILFLHNIDNFLIERNVILGEGGNGSIDGNIDFGLQFKDSFKVCLLFFGQFLQIVVDGL